MAAVIPVPALISVDPEKCTGCRACEMACSLYKHKVCNPEKSYIRVVVMEMEAIYIPMLCAHCETALCMDVCPFRAITKDPKTGAVLISKEACVGCRLCTYVCPIGAIWLDRIEKIVVKCDLCEGRPRCVEFCAPRAITYSPPRKAAKEKMRTRANRITKGLIITRKV